MDSVETKPGQVPVMQLGERVVMRNRLISEGRRRRIRVRGQSGNSSSSSGRRGPGTSDVSEEMKSLITTYHTQQFVRLLYNELGGRGGGGGGEDCTEGRAATPGLTQAVTNFMHCVIPEDETRAAYECTQAEVQSNLEKVEQRQQELVTYLHHFYIYLTELMSKPRADVLLSLPFVKEKMHNVNSQYQALSVQMLLLDTIVKQLMETINFNLLCMADRRLLQQYYNTVAQKLARYSRGGSAVGLPAEQSGEGVGEVSSSQQPAQQHYCYCGEGSHGQMIACDNLHCAIEWYHFDCVGITRAPADEQEWYCPVCANLPRAVRDIP